MTTPIEVTVLDQHLPFGATVAGVNWNTLVDEGVRNHIKDIFEDRGLIVFKDMEPSTEMQLALSDIFGPPQEYAIKEVSAVDNKTGLVELNYDGNLVDADGKVLAGWVPWHYDACYTAKLNRGGALRAIIAPPEGGLTGFADGIQLYNAISPELRARFANWQVIYHTKLMFKNQRFGVPKNYNWLEINDASLKIVAAGEESPRSVHPAIWKRKSGQYVLHVSPWQAAGVYGHEDAEGHALLESLCQEIYAKMNAYWHKWRLTDMLVWDNWRFIHCAGGNDPKYARCLQRTTITGDYGLGCFERDALENERRELTH